MPTDGKFTRELVRRLRQSLEHLNSVQVFSDEDAALLKKVKTRIRDTIVEIESDDMP